MVAGSRFKRNQSAMNELRPYTLAYEETVAAIVKNTVLYSHPFFGTQRASVKNDSEDGGLNNSNSPGLGIILISTDRGLCGAFNINLFKLIQEQLISGRLVPGQARFYVVGKKGTDFLKKEGLKAAFARIFLEVQDVKQLSSELSDSIIADFNGGIISDVYIASNEYISTIRQKPSLRRILPFGIPSGEQRVISGGYLIDPVFKEDEILDAIFRKYISVVLTYKIIESQTSEQAARMNAMDNATRNSGNLINKLTVSYNKARQAAVTLEILDIINGVNAVS